jgi:hypothetical protein
MDAPTADRDCWVVCIEHVVGPFTKAGAEARMADITRNIVSGCRRDHHIVQSAGQPEPSYPPDGPQPLPATS